MKKVIVGLVLGLAGLVMAVESYKEYTFSIPAGSTTAYITNTMNDAWGTVGIWAVSSTSTNAGGTGTFTGKVYKRIGSSDVVIGSGTLTTNGTDLAIYLTNGVAFRQNEVLKIVTSGTRTNALLTGFSCGSIISKSR